MDIPFCFQGSQIGFIMGFIAIFAVGLWFVLSKWEALHLIKQSSRAWLVCALLAIWAGSFINVGHTQNSLQRQSFDSIGKLGVEDAERVIRETPTPADISKRAQETAREIHENAQ